MEKTYTETEIKTYFQYIIKTCPNSIAAEQAEIWLYRMFEKNYDTLEKVTEKLKKENKNV